MKARIHAITLGVDDLDLALRFYRDGLGLPTTGVIGAEFPGSASEPAGLTVMFTLDDGLVLSLYPRTELAKDAGIASGAVSGTGVSIGHTVESREEVDRLLHEAEQAGGTITGPAKERPWLMYSGYFRDPDGHLWEVMHFLGGYGDTP